MMNKVLLVLAIAGYTMAAGPFSSVGADLADANIGFCLAFQDNQNDKTTSCYT